MPDRDWPDGDWPDRDGPRAIWSDSTLDAALAAFNSGVSPDERALATARAELIAAASGDMTTAASGATEQGSPMSTSTHLSPAANRPAADLPPEPPSNEPHRELPQRRLPAAWRRSRPARWLTAAAVVSAVAATALVLQSVQFGGGPAANSAAASALNAAADHIGATDQPVAPGQYRYLESHVWNTHTATNGTSTYVLLQEERMQTWVPADQRQDWLYRRSPGQQRWITGSRQQAEADGMDLNGHLIQGEWRAACGDFFAAEETPAREPCTNQAGGWQNPTPEWAGSLPRDPRQLLDRLRRDAPGADEGNDRGDVELLVYAADALRTGLLPADLRAALYRALALVPALRVTEDVANLDGQRGIALGMDTDGERHDIIIDPGTGAFIGERQTATRDIGGLPAGTAGSSTSLRTSVVDEIGATPSG